MNRNDMPLVLMLVAGLITCIITFIRHFTVFHMLLALFICLLISFILGSIVKGMLNYFDKQNEEKNMEAGEVIEKEAGTLEDVSPEGTVKPDEAVKSV